MRGFRPKTEGKETGPLDPQQKPRRRKEGETGERRKRKK